MCVRQISFTLVSVLLLSAPARAYSEAEANAFRKADANGDKLIDKKEFRILIEEMAAIGADKALSVKRWGAYGIGFKRADANGDGMISVGELQAQR
jgi:Ca2+-binding EF-hand superfamily protein